MTGKELWQKYIDFTKDLSDNARKLAFAAAALSWAFKSGSGVFPPEVTIALLSIIVFFISDMLQYITGALTLRVWLHKEKIKKYDEAGKIEDDVQQPEWIDTLPKIFCFIKVIALFVSYIYLGIYLL